MLLIFCICKRKCKRCRAKEEGMFSTDFEENSFFNDTCEGNDSINNETDDDHTGRESKASNI